MSQFNSPSSAADDGSNSTVSQQSNRRHHCTASLPLSAAPAGLIAANWQCSDRFRWGIQAGAAAFAFKHWSPYATGRLGISYPPHGSSIASSLPIPAETWVAQAELGYVFLPETAFDKLEGIAGKHWFSSPALQQWSLLADSDASIGLTIKNHIPGALIHSYGVRIWQTLPAQWRTIGALRDTRNAEIHGIIFEARSRKGRWNGALGVGRMTVEIDRISLSFFYPKAELNYDLSDFNENSETSKNTEMIQP